MSPPSSLSSRLGHSAHPDTSSEEGLPKKFGIQDPRDEISSTSETRVLQRLNSYDGEPLPPLPETPPRLRANLFATNPTFMQRLTFPLDPASLQYYSSGKVESGLLKMDTVINGVTFTKGTRIRLYEDGKLRIAILGTAQKIQGIPCAPGPIWFHPNGKLSQAQLASDQKIQGVLCARGDIWLHDNGSLAQATLVADQNIQGIPCQRGTVWFHRSRHLSQAKLSVPQKIFGFPLAANTNITFHKNGAFRSGVLDTNHTVGGLVCIGGSAIWFHDNSHLAEVTLGSDQTIQGKTFVVGDRVRFKENGDLE